MIALLLLSNLLTLAVLLVACVKIERVQAEVRSEQVKHKRCHVQTEAALGQSMKRLHAQALRSAATAWGSVEEQPRLADLARKKYKPGGPSMPEIWLNDRAAALDPTFEEIS